MRRIKIFTAFYQKRQIICATSHLLTMLYIKLESIGTLLGIEDNKFLFRQNRFITNPKRNHAQEFRRNDFRFSYFIFETRWRVIPRKKIPIQFDVRLTLQNVFWVVTNFFPKVVLLN